MVIVGDVHGKINDFRKLTTRLKPAELIQLGDFGFKKQHDWFIDNIPAEFKILFGNHDYYPYKYMDHSMGDFQYLEKYKLMTMRGAWSVDQYNRTEGLDWFRDEQMSYKEWDECITMYEEKKPEIVVSHDCPFFIRETLFGYDNKTITSSGLQQCFEIHQPDLWIFGHHHESLDLKISGTNFICLNELENYNI